MLGDVVRRWGAACGESSKVEDGHDVVEYGVMGKVDVAVDSGDSKRCIPVTSAFWLT